MKIITKILTLFLITILSQNSFAQFPIDEETGQVKYTEVVELPGMTKKQIYDKAKFWIVSTLKSGDNMVELSGTGSEQIIGTGNLVIDSILNPLNLKSTPFLSNSYLNFKFIVFCKDNKFKYSLENIVFSYQWGTQYTQKLSNIKLQDHRKLLRERFDKNKPYINRELIRLTKNFIYVMKKKDSDDW